MDSLGRRTLFSVDGFLASWDRFRFSVNWGTTIEEVIIVDNISSLDPKWATRDEELADLFPVKTILKISHVTPHHKLLLSPMGVLEIITIVARHEDR